MFKSFIYLILLASFHQFHHCFRINQSNSTKKILTKQNKLIVILAHGIRYDYLNDLSNLKGFQYLNENGVKAEVQPIFPSNSYPNWYTILTGLYAENHGMVNNFMHDDKYNETFLMTPPTSHSPHWWNESEPVWIKAEKNGLKTAVYYWDGCEIPINKTLTTKCEPYRSYWTWPNIKEDYRTAFDEILTNFKQDKWQFSLVYYEPIDSNGHVFGPNSVSRRDALKDLDDLLIYLIDEMQKKELDQEVNILLVSDHGMLDVQSKKKKTILIDIDNYLDENDVEVMLDRGSIAFIIPKPGKENKILDDLKKSNIKGISFYRKEDIPDLYHFKHHRRIGRILLLANKGYFIRGFSDGSKTKPHWDVIYKGHHGYDPYFVEEMKTIMFAFGPKLKKGYQNRPLMMTDHYNLMCNLLEIQPKKNDGNWTRVLNMLEDGSSRNSTIKISKMNKLVKSSKPFKRESNRINSGSLLSQTHMFIGIVISLSILYRFKSTNHF